MTRIVPSLITSLTPGTQVTVVCSGPIAQPGAELQAGSRTCGIKLGARVMSVDCGTLPAGSPLPGDTARFRVSDGQQIDGTGVIADGSGCAFSAKKGEELDLYALDPSPTDHVLVVDFVPTSAASAGSSTIGFDVRCGQLECVSLRLQTDGSYELDEHNGSKDSTLFQGKFGGEGYPVPELEVDRPNRLVIVARKNEVSAYLNGRLMGSAQTTVTGSQPDSVWLANDSSTTDATLHVLAMSSYEAA